MCAHSVCVCACVCTYRASGQNSGCSSLLPCRRNTVMSKEFTSEYGGAPRVISSHSNTPNDHYRKNEKINFFCHHFPFTHTFSELLTLYWKEGFPLQMDHRSYGVLTTSDLVVNLCVCRLSRAIHLTGSLTPFLLWTL